MPRNTMMDLANHLFAELERLDDEDLAGDELTNEIARAHAIGKVSKTIIDSGNLMVRAAEFNDSKIDADQHLPALLENGQQR